MKKIVVPIDFSPASRNASEYAASLARLFAGEIYLLHVFMEPVPVTDVPVAWMIHPNELQQDLDARVQKESSYLKDKYAIEVLRKSQTPVLVVPQAASFVPIDHIVLASDLQEVADDSYFEIVFRIAEKFGAALQVVYVQKWRGEMAASQVPGRRQLERMLSKASFSYQEVEDDSVEHGILDFIQDYPADLLVMVAHHHTIFERFFGTVHTWSISHEIKIPLLVLKDKAIKMINEEAYSSLIIHF